MTEKMKVSVFGGSQPRPGDEAYQDALRMGKLLGEAGYIVLNGGYIGTMEAISKGAAEAGAQVIGVTCDEIETWRPVSPNPYLTQEMRYKTIHQRLLALIQESEAVLALPGGPGTLTEISLTWNLLITGAIPPRALILIGNGWHKTFDALMESLGQYIPTEQRDWLVFTPGIESAVERVKTWIP